ncbi:adaptor protein MecA [Lottiidibacillus patelloidae]|uniref:Adapter protein MecA n=1 Tax=Lottiidibacillus patelloidae TaxID=2670334 RepID=A0A263BX10_9BACI|nr:adaptor protein MecA [Lottiidibacillus patelloidae]OZM58269.1 adaptor protein MecA [Lottiidibacillus patelloidae]
MEIERINDNTVKFYISYGDIEERGFDREEIWQNRERGEELFWEMMDEVNEEEEFTVEGPLWIQVQALEKGLEMTVTRATLSEDGSKIEVPLDGDKQIDVPVHEKIESLLDKQFGNQDDDDDLDHEESDLEDEEEMLQFLLSFQDFEDVLSLSEQVSVKSEEVENNLYVMDNIYYLDITFQETMPAKLQDDILSQMLEYGVETSVTIHLVQEYGKLLIAGDALSELKGHFSK